MAYHLLVSTECNEDFWREVIESIMNRGLRQDSLWMIERIVMTRYTDYEVDISAGFLVLLYNLICDPRTKEAILSVMSITCVFSSD